MKPETLEWIKKAEADWRTMLRESDVLDEPNFDAICFHAQQCIEKYLKARLFDATISFGKTHDLLNLLDSLKPVEPQFKMLHKALSELSVFSVAYRYPGFNASKEQAQRSVEHCTSIRSTLRNSFKLKADE